MKLAVITSGFLPVPATKGGAVENLLMNIVKENEKYNSINMEIFSVYDEKALLEANNYKSTNFVFIKINPFVKLMDKMVFFTFKNILKRKNSHSYRYIFQRLFYLYKCSKLLKKNSYDKVLLENHPSQYLALKWHKNYLKYKDNYYYHCHNEFPSTYGCEEIIRDTKNIFCVSEFRKNTIVKYMNIDENRFSVLKNVVDGNVISKKANEEELDEIRKKYSIGKEDKVLIYSGRIVPGKGVGELIKAIKKVKRDDFKVLILGSSLNSLSVKSKFEEEIFSLVTPDIKSKIVFTGFIKYDELYKYYSLADIAILPSTWDDSAPLTVIEALCSGIPLITTNSGGIPEYAIDDSAIILDKDKNLVEELVSSIVMLLEDNKKLESLSKNAKKVSCEMSLEKFYKGFVQEVNK